MTQSIFFRALGLMAALPAFLSFSVPARADNWVFDKQLTEVRFSWDNLGLGRRSARFTEVDGTLDFAPTEPETGAVEVVIRAASLSTGAREFDDAMKSPDFFAVASNPRITFRSTGIAKTGERTGDIKGELTILGISKPVTLAATWNFTGEHPLAASNPTYQGKWVSGFSAAATVLRSDFGIKRGIPLLSDEIRIEINAVFVRKE